MTTPVRLVVVDDHPVVRAGLAALLAADPSIEVVGEAASAAEAVVVTERRRPDVVLMDLQLGDGVDGVGATRRLLALDPAPRVVILTTHESDADVLASVEAGACGYLLKDAPAAELAEAVRTAARGGTVLAPVVARRLDERRRSPEPVLSARELDVLRLVAAGEPNREIARALFLSEATVKSHLVRAFGKLGVTSRTAAVASARSRGLIR
ncbi:response regulator transcription factor [Intrasporangium calvum]|uniref:Response regulator transcription factor n=1 Tax=Intrasporangium calvum TaxID=53358 RepID=A0ABT5GE94_9MICO|nr:response regulator transcription factor [Intrasporangium calvum]MDC5696001.1 response regulator transcription factor [Intrasporangium calvum]